MAKNNKADMSCARVKKYTASDVSKAERHNERKNETYENMNVIEERIPYNVHFKKPFAPTYMEQLKQMETDGLVSLRGLRKDATLFNEIVIDVNTMYFERNGGYEYAKQFYEEAFHFIEEKFGADNIISAVMHADEINVAATEELGKEVYHYHLHAMVLPVVEKEILWSKRCKDEKLRGTVKEVVHQISHSKKWKSDIPLTDEKGNPLLRKNGKPMFRASYSILQDELFNHMTEQGFKGFQRGEYGSTAEHLTSLQYQIKQDKERLEKLQKRIQREQIKYEPARNVSKTYNEIDRMGQKTITGKMAISKEDYSELTALAKEGITSRAEISELEQSANYYRQKYFDCANALERMKTKYNELKEKCRPFLQALEHFPEVAKLFTEKVKQLFSFKEAQERAEKEAREKERQERIKARRNKRGTERQTRQIADHKLTWACGRHHYCVAVLRVHLSADVLDGCHVLRDLRTEIGAIDHSRVAVWVHMIYTVSIESEGRAGLHCRAKHQPHDVLDGDAALFDARVIDAVQIPLLPFCTPVILQCVALDREDLMRTHEMPRRVYVLLRQSPEEIRIAHGGKHIMRLHAVIAVVGAQLKEFRQIPVPCV